MSLGFFNGNQEAAYRETSAKPGIVMPKSKLCPGCKKPRSPANSLKAARPVRNAEE